jgi:hypothetical protein
MGKSNHGRSRVPLPASYWKNRRQVIADDLARSWLAHANHPSRLFDCTALANYVNWLRLMEYRAETRLAAGPLVTTVADAPEDEVAADVIVTGDEEATGQADE